MAKEGGVPKRNANMSEVDFQDFFVKNDLQSNECQKLSNDDWIIFMKALEFPG